MNNSQQLIKKNKSQVFPKTFLDAIKSRETGQSLDELLQGFNMYFVYYNGNIQLSRCQIPIELRKRGLWITYINFQNEVCTEWYDANEIDNDSWGNNSNWRQGNNRLIGDISISANGNWVVNGKELDAKAKGDKGETPILRYNNLTLEVSYNKGKKWEELAKFENKLLIQGYVATIEELPKNAVQGDIWMVGPTYDEDDTSHDYPHYRMWVKQSSGWVDNGEFTNAGPVSTNNIIDGAVTIDKLAPNVQSLMIYDISAHNSNAVFESLQSLLSSTDLNILIPTSVRHGGMSIRFIQSSGNKYVQYRLMADAWSTDTEDWAIADEGIYVDNPEFVYVKTDKEGKIIFGIKTDGEPYFGVGCPQQVKQYIEEKIEDLSLDEYEDVVAFLSDYLGSDTTLKIIIDGINAAKVDKIEGKSLIDTEYASSQSAIENPEFLEVITDSEGKVLEGIQQDGTKVIGGDFKVLGNMEVSGVSYNVVENPEYLVAWVDAEDKVLFGLKADGKTYVGDVDFLNEIKNNQDAINEIKSYLAKFDNLDIDALSSIITVENSEYIEAKTDSEGKILAGRTPDGAAFENVGFSTLKVSIDGHIIENIEDPEGRTEILTDSEGKIVSYRDTDGVKHELVGIETNHLELGEDGLTDLEKALKAHGFSGDQGDWSDSELVEIPIPKICAIVNIEADKQAETKGSDIKTHIQFWDKFGNYFRKPIILNAQGSSSMSYHIKNQAIDLDDGSKIKFGNWLAFDSFHLKKYFIDVFRGQCIVCYRLGEQVYQTRPICEQRPWSYMNNNTAIDAGLGSFDKDFNNEAMAHPDGFPIHLFFNGKDAGIYAFNIKKDRSNYNCKKNTQKHIILDGVLGSVFWNANGNLNKQGQTGESIWNDFEVRNPKIATDINGNKYDGDHPTEPSDDYAACKAYISRLTTYKTAINAENTIEAKKAKCEEFFNVPFFIDYDLIGQITYNYDGYSKNWIWLTNDGNIWSPTIYDMDSVFGQHWNGASYVENSEIGTPGLYPDMPTGVIYNLYKVEYEARYKELRDKGIFTVDNICKLFKEWLDACGQSNLKNDIENITVSPYIENGEVVKDEQGNPILIPNTPSYRDGSKEYVYRPTVGGWYNSLQRVHNWLVARIAFLDTHYNYNKN